VPHRLATVNCAFTLNWIRSDHSLYLQCPRVRCPNTSRRWRSAHHDEHTIVTVKCSNARFFLPPVPRLPLRLLVFGAMHAGHFAQFITELHAEILGSHLHFRVAISCIRSPAAPASGPSCLHILLIDQHNASIDSLARYYSALRRGCSRGSSRVGRAQTTFHAAPTGPEAPPSYNHFRPTVEE
jgi:hypothetical protein